MCFSLIEIIFKRRRRLYMTAKSRLSVIVAVLSLGTVLNVYGSPQLELKRAEHFEHLSYFSKGKCVRQQPLALSQRTRPPLSRLVALLARGNTRNTPDTSPFPRWKWVAFLLPFLSFFLSALSTPPLVAPRPGAARRARAPRVWGRRVAVVDIGYEWTSASLARV